MVDASDRMLTLRVLGWSLQAAVNLTSPEESFEFLHDSAPENSSQELSAHTSPYTTLKRVSVINQGMETIPRILQPQRNGMLKLGDVNSKLNGAVETNPDVTGKHNLCDSTSVTQLDPEPVSGEEKEQILSKYLDRIKTRRAEIDAIRLQPEWLLEPIVRVHKTHYAEDEESKRIGDALEGFFNSGPTTGATATEAPRSYQHDFDFEQPNADIDLITNDFELLTIKSPTRNFDPASSSASEVPLLASFKSTPRALVKNPLNPTAPVFKLPKKDSKDLEELTLFLRLPDIVRRKIWKLARPVTRLIHLRLSKDGKSVYSKAPVPAILHACRQSRAIALESYQLSFAKLLPGGGNGIRKVYFDFKNDGIYTRCSGCFSFTVCCHKRIWTLDHEKVRGLIFEGPLSRNPFPKIAKLYPNVRGLLLVRGKSTMPRGEIKWEDINNIDEPFEWQFGSLVESYKREVLSGGLMEASVVKLRKATRITVKGVDNATTPIERKPATFSGCY